MGAGPLPQSDTQATLARIGVVTALPQEARSLRHAREAAGRSGEQQGPAVEVSGVGARRAREAAHRLIESGARSLVSWGTAAGLRRGLAAGTLLLPETVIDVRGQRFHADARWHQAMVAELAVRAQRLSTGPLAETGRLLGSARDKEVLLESTAAVAADMESAAVAQAAREAGVPFLAVRAVADPAHGLVPRSVARAMDDQGRVHVPKLLMGALVAPAQWVHIVRLAWWFRAAEGALSQAARCLGESARR